MSLNFQATNPPAAQNVVLVEDDEELSDLVASYLDQNGFNVSIIDNGTDAIKVIRSLQPDIVILDLMLPGEDGLTVCGRVRPYYDGPILMLTARSDELDQVVGLEMGADDYVAKPVQPRVLLARLKALLRRQSIKERHDQEVIPMRLKYGELVIDSAVRDVWLNEKVIELTSAEFDLLWLLMSHAGTILSRDDIYGELSGGCYDGSDRTIDVRISRIRSKIGDDPINPNKIKTVRNKGYLFVKRI